MINRPTLKAAVIGGNLFTQNNVITAQVPALGASNDATSYLICFDEQLLLLLFNALHVILLIWQIK